MTSKCIKKRTLDANNNTVITTKPINLGTEQNYGLDLNTSVDITKWWKVMANLDLFGYKTKENIKELIIVVMVFF